MTLTHHAFPVASSGAFSDPTFWVGVATAAGTIGAAVVAAWLGRSAFRSESKRNDGYAVAELNRQAELQAVLVRTHPGASGDRAVVNVRNDSDRPIFRVRGGIRAGGSDDWHSTEYPRLESELERNFDFDMPSPASASRTSLLEFTDAYGRRWQLVSNTLTLVEAADIRGTAETRKHLLRQFGS